MPLTTRCARCGHLFAIYAQELKRRRGRVHCPRCAHRLDALAGLIDEPMLGPDSAADRFRPGLGMPADLPIPERGAHTLRERLGLARRPAPVAPPVHPASAAAAEGSSSTAGASRLGSWARIGSLGRGLPGLGGPGLGRRLAWGLAALILLLAIPLQVAWWKRADLLRDPVARARLAALCNGLGCELPAPRLAGTLEVLEPTLIPHTETGALVLKLSMRNGAPLAQPAPLLELELLDPQGERAALRRFKPGEYGLPESKALLDPGETLPLTLELRKPDLEMSGFKVRLL